MSETLSKDNLNKTILCSFANTHSNAGKYEFGKITSISEIASDPERVAIGIQWEDNHFSRINTTKEMFTNFTKGFTTWFGNLKIIK